MAGKRINPRTGSVLRGIESFHDSNGLRFDPSHLHSDVVRAYLVNSTLAPSTLGTYRWVLTNALDLDLGVDLSFPGSKGATPYSDADRSDLVSIEYSAEFVHPIRSFRTLLVGGHSMADGCARLPPYFTSVISNLNSKYK